MRPVPGRPAGRSAAINRNAKAGEGASYAGWRGFPPARHSEDARTRSPPKDQTGRPPACEELMVNAQPSGPGKVNESWMLPRRISDGDSPLSA